MRDMDPLDPTLNPFDQLHGQPDVVSSAECSITATSLADSSTFIVRTLRQRDVGNLIVLQRLDRHGSIRILLPPKVAEAIALQRDELVTTAAPPTAKWPPAAQRGITVKIGGKSLTELARAIDVTPSYMSRLRRGERTPSIAVLDKLVTATGLPEATIRELFAPANYAPPPQTPKKGTTRGR